jgi:hypothetical protein
MTKSVIRTTLHTYRLFTCHTVWYSAVRFVGVIDILCVCVIDVVRFFGECVCWTVILFCVGIFGVGVGVIDVIFVGVSVSVVGVSVVCIA